MLARNFLNRYKNKPRNSGSIPEFDKLFTNRATYERRCAARDKFPDETTVKERRGKEKKKERGQEREINKRTHQCSLTASPDALGVAARTITQDHVLDAGRARRTMFLADPSIVITAARRRRRRRRRRGKRRRCSRVLCPSPRGEEARVGLSSLTRDDERVARPET